MSEIVEIEILKDAKIRMGKAINLLSSEYARISAGRVTPSLLDKITVDYYGTNTKIAQLASISVVQSTILSIQPFDPSVCGDIEKAISSSDLGVNPQNDGKIIRVNFPAPTEEGRIKIAKEISKIAEEIKVSVRNIRRDAMDRLKRLNKDSLITQDALSKGSSKIQDLTDKCTKEIDSILKNKREEILKV
ncbi:MAG: ribosome recycling factor [Oscillospiraceae bacterium]|jgi:ribosome recycling factor|nr:ribosome recycling factor [Oscillospiraceae bacterium]